MTKQPPLILCPYYTARMFRKSQPFQKVLFLFCKYFVNARFSAARGAMFFCRAFFFHPFTSGGGCDKIKADHL